MIGLSKNVPNSGTDRVIIMARRGNKSGCLGSILGLFAAALCFAIPVLIISYVADWLHVSFWGAVAIILLSPVVLLLCLSLFRAVIRCVSRKPKSNPGGDNLAKSSTPSAEDDEKLPDINDLISQSVTIDTQADLDIFMQHHTLQEELRTKVVGVTHANQDGTSRQPIIARCHSGDPVYLHFYRYKGDPAYAVYTDGGQIGNLSAELAEYLYTRYGENAFFHAGIINITGGYSGRYFGCNLDIRVYL